MNKSNLTLINISALLISMFTVLFFCKIAKLGYGVGMSWFVVLSPLWFPIVFIIALYIIFIILTKIKRYGKK